MPNQADLHSRLVQSLNDFRDPETGRPLSKTGQVTDWMVTPTQIECTLWLTTHSQPIAEEVVFQFRDHLLAQLSVDGAMEAIPKIIVHSKILKRPAASIGQIGLKAKSVIVVGAGKGGVGKSTLAASLAICLMQLGSQVGLMDADVYGPSIPHLLVLTGRPEIVDGKIQPIDADGMPVMSMGFVLEKDQAVIWRGPMLHGSITQFLRDTHWGELDYLIIDLPPGTGDVVLTLSQLLPLAGAVVVCTPQEVALLDAAKAIAMFQKTKTPILGVVENMSGFTCPDTGKTYDIFGKGGARLKAEEVDVPFLGEIPINVTIRERSDEGELIAALQEPIAAEPFKKIARAMVRSLADESKKRGGSAAPLPVLG